MELQDYNYYCCDCPKCGKFDIDGFPVEYRELKHLKYEIDEKSLGQDIEYLVATCPRCGYEQFTKVKDADG